MGSKFIDSHAHLSFKDYKNDLDEVINRAWDSGLSHIINIGVGHEKKEFDAAISIAEKYKNIYATVGVHPHDAKCFTQDHINLFKEYLKNPKVVAIGEMGLDFHYNHSDPDIQKAAFKAQLLLAKEMNVPVIIHDRNAHKECLEIVKDAGYYNGVFHCFSGDLSLAQEVVDLGFYISIPGVVTFKKADEIRGVVNQILLERLLIETDCPFLAPVPYRGKRNEPSYVVKVAEAIAEIKNISLEDVADQTTLNAIQLFNINLQIKKT
ncbi:TatD family hydrolase [bacterium]|nr:TatD family hydrolase [bacterium]